jgi:hypothetical protein
MNVFAFLAAEPVGFSGNKADDRPLFVLLIHAVRPAGLERHDLGVPGVRAVNGSDTPARERAERIKRVIGRDTTLNFRGSSHCSAILPGNWLLFS